MTTNMSKNGKGHMMEMNDPIPFCLLCNNPLTDSAQKDPTDEKKDEEQELFLVNLSGSGEIVTDDRLLNIAQEMEEVHGEGSGTDAGSVSQTKEIEDKKIFAATIGTTTKRSGLSDADWVQKYQCFLSKTLHLNLEDFAEEDHVHHGRINYFTGVKKSKSLEKELLLFCGKCQLQVEKFHQNREQVNVATKAFEDIRESIATSIVKTFVERKLRVEELNSEDPNMEEAKNSATETLLEKWKYIYSGEADRELKERNLINEIRDEFLARNETQTRTEFPEGTGLSAMELAKMQRMMTACYFIPKMSIARKKGKLFFRVAIPRDDKEKAKIFHCPICNDTFNHQRSLNVHMRRHKSTRPIRQVQFTCPTCGVSFPDRKTLIFHKRSHYIGTVDGPKFKYQRVQEYFTCCICSCRFASKSSRNSHLKKYHPNDRLFTCALCLEIFKCETTLKEHFENTHRPITEQNNGGHLPHPNELFTCIECSKQFLKIKSLIEHRRVHAMEALSECYYCGMGFEGMDSLREHTNVTHMIPNPFNCDGCEESFPTEETLIEHMKSKAQRNSTYICETCGRISRSKEALQKHLLTHAQATESMETETDESEEHYEEEELHVCDICEESFTDSSGLEAHMTQQHAATLPVTFFLCNICTDSDKFNDEGDLRKHKIDVHPDTVESLPHHCTVCWHSFETQEDLETHTAQKHERFQCQMCNRVFKLSEHLRRHMFVHTGEKPFKCNMCDKSFNRESSLKEHIHRHQGVRPHRCPKCKDVSFLRRGHLKEHIIQEHGGVEDGSSIPSSRAAQNLRRSSTATMPGVIGESAITPTVITADSIELIKGEEGQTIQVISLTSPLTLPQTKHITKPLIVNDVTVRDDGLHERFAPLIMKSLQNKSNQPIIVRRGIQVPDKSTFPYAAAIQIKSGGITTDGEIIEATEGNGDDEEDQQQQYIIYNV